MRAFEAHDLFGVAIRKELVWPDTRMRLGVVNQSSITGCTMRFTIDAFNVARAAAVTLRIHAKLVFAAGSADWCH